MEDSIDLVLDQCLSDLLSGRASVEKCLARHPAQAARLAPALRAAAQLQQIPSVPALTPARRQALENRVLARLSPRSTQRPAEPLRTARLPFWQRGLTWATAIVMALLVLTATTVGAAAGSLPGDFLYPVKQMTEQATLALTPPEAQPAVHAELAQRRLGEFAALLERGEVMPALLDNANSELALALDTSDTLPPDQQATVLEAVEKLDTGQMGQVNEALDQAISAVEAALSEAPDNADGLDKARARLLQLRDQIPQKAGHESTGKPAEPPGAGKGQPPNEPPGQANPPGQDNSSPPAEPPGQQGQGQGQGQGQTDKGKGIK